METFATDVCETVQYKPLLVFTEVSSIQLQEQELKLLSLIQRTEELMARLTMVLESLEPDAIVSRINAATTQITRAGSVAAAARPLVAEEVQKIHFTPGAIKQKLAEEIESNKIDKTEMKPTAARDSIKDLPDETRDIVLTEESEGKQRVLAVQRKSDTGALEIVYLGA